MNHGREDADSRGDMLALLWRGITWWPVPLVFAAMALACAVVSVLVDQQSSFTEPFAGELTGFFSGWFEVDDILHSGVFLVAAVGLGVSTAFLAIDRLLSERTIDRGWLFEGLFWAGLVAVLVTSLLHLFLFREVEVPLGPSETALVPSLDLTMRGEATGWTPEGGSLATLEVAPRLAGSDLAGPFGDRDRPADASLAADSIDLELSGGGTVDFAGVDLRLSEPPVAWAGRVEVMWQGRTDTSPFLQSGQGWTSAQLLADPALQVAVDRVIPDFDPTVSIILQALGGPAVAPAAILTLSQDNDVVGSRAFVPGETAVMGEFTVALVGFAPVVEVVLSRGSFVRELLAALAVTFFAGAASAVDLFLRRRARTMLREPRED